VPDAVAIVPVEFEGVRGTTFDVTLEVEEWDAATFEGAEARLFVVPAFTP
jgi:hypothetical protein